MATLTLLDPQNGTVADANLIKSNNDAIEALVNGQLDATNMDLTNSIEMADLTAAVAQALCPTGTIFPFGGTAAPAGWLLCDGTKYLQATYPALFNVFSTRFNTGGELGTEFRMPDMRGCVPVGAGQGPAPLTNRVLAARAGEENHTLTMAQMPQHSHHANGTTPTGGATQASSMAGSIITTLASFNEYPGVNVVHDMVTAATNYAPHTHAISPAGSGSPHNVMQPFLVLNYIAKT
jgi:microcystin-dependent protein